MIMIILIFFVSSSLIMNILPHLPHPYWPKSWEYSMGILGCHFGQFCMWFAHECGNPLTNGTWLIPFKGGMFMQWDERDWKISIIWKWERHPSIYSFATILFTFSILPLAGNSLSVTFAYMNGASVSSKSLCFGIIHSLNARFSIHGTVPPKETGEPKYSPFQCFVPPQLVQLTMDDSGRKCG
jgi:hypothetical protein